MNRFIYKVLIILLTLSVIVVIGGGYYINKNRVVDNKNYLETIDTSEDFEYEPELDFEYIEERVVFSNEVENYLSTMSDEERIAQLFFISLEELSDEEEVTRADNIYMEYPVGGIIYSSKNTSSISQTRLLINNVNSESLNKIGLPLLSSYEDNEVPLSEIIHSDDIYSPTELSEQGDDNLVDNYIENRIYELSSLGLNTYTNLNVNLNSQEFENINYFGSDPIYAADITQSFVNNLKTNNIISFVKTFPIQNNTTLSLNELITSDLMVLQSAIDKDCEGVFLSNGVCKSITESASLKVYESENSFDVLRGRLGFEGIALASNLESEKVLDAFLAGCDMFYMPNDFKASYDVLLDALKDGKISPTRINNAVGRIISAKLLIS